ncbi:MAG: acyl-CoA desaturase [Bacteriovoracia bacterium]
MTQDHAAREVAREWNDKPDWSTAKPNWVNIVFLTGFPLITLVATIWYLRNYGFQWSDAVVFLVMMVFVGFSITGGYHRLFAHRTYESNRALKLFFLCFGAAGLQNSVLHWASDHRFHHLHVDKASDPYNINKGFWWAHIGWIFFGDPVGRNYKNAVDLERDPLVQWQARYYLRIATVFGLGFPALLGWTMGNPVGGIVWGCLVRTVVLHHATFLINSGAHYFGSRPYSTDSTARDCWWLAVPALGEGYHNFHHTFASDYRNGVRWYQYDPSKWFIYLLEKIGVTSKLQRVPDALIIKSRLNRKHEQARELLESRASAWSDSVWEAMEKSLARAEEALGELSDVKKRYRQWWLTERKLIDRRERRLLKTIWVREMKAYKAAFRDARRGYIHLWQQLRRQVSTVS